MKDTNGNPKCENNIKKVAVLKSWFQLVILLLLSVIMYYDFDTTNESFTKASILLTLWPIQGL